MNAKQEFVTCTTDCDMNERSKEGYEFVCVYYQPTVEMKNCSESGHHSPQTYITVSSDGSPPPQNYNNQYNNSQTIYKDIPVVVPYPRFLMRLKSTAKILYGEKGNAKPETET